MIKLMAGDTFIYLNMLVFVICIVFINQNVLLNFSSRLLVINSFGKGSVYVKHGLDGSVYKKYLNFNSVYKNAWQMN